MGSGRKKEFDPEEALQIAMQTFWREGYAGTSFTSLVEATGVGRQSLYDTFGDKQAIFERAVEHYGRTETARVTGILDQSGDPLANIHQVFELWRSGASGRDFSGCFVGNSIGAAALSDRGLEGIFEEQLGEIEAAFARAIKAAIEAGSIPPDKNARQLARSLVALSQGLFLMAQAGAGPAAIRDIIKTARSLLE